ncbi:NADPH:quinone reductase-like Zn-dependent oxidoreductase [Pedobacter sp. UYP24]
MKTILNQQSSSNSATADLNAIKVVLPGIVQPEGFLIEKLSIPAPGAGQVLIKVEATGISFAEQSMRRARYPGQPSFPFVPGYDLAGTVTVCGEGVDADWLGKRVAALTKTGGWASHVIAEVGVLLNVPLNVDPAEAESLVVNGITAWQMLHRAVKLKSGDTILVHGVNGGVGTILTQLAQLDGLRIIGMASARHHQVLREKGIEPVDYHDSNWDKVVRKLAPEGVAAVFDNIGGETAERSFRLIKKGGKLVCMAISSELNSTRSLWLPFIYLIAKVLWWKVFPNGKDATFYNIWAGKGSIKFMTDMTADYDQLMALVQAGKLKPQIAARYPLSEIVTAMKFAESRTAYGKVILLP